VVAAVTGFGLFVELADLYIEGLVHISALPADYYHYDQGRQRLTGERSGRSFNLGDAVKVQVARVDLDEKKIDLELLEALSRRDRSASGAAAKRGKSQGKKQQGKPRKGSSRSGLRRRR
jgi:ribonuclease R